MNTRYTTPIIKKGKEVKSGEVPKGSSKPAEQAKRTWYIEYYYEGKQVRVKRGLNRIVNHHEKQLKADALRLSIINDLASGYNPFNQTEFLAQVKIDNITLVDAIKVFKDYHQQHQSRKKTIGTYMSKLIALSAFYPGILIREITTPHLEDFVRSKINDGTYAQESVKSAKRILGTFFSVLIKKGYAKKNPRDGFDKKIKSNKEIEDKHTPYTDADMATIMTYLDANDRYTAFVCRMIYFTCIRPGEIRNIQLKDINLGNNTITLRASVKKTTSNHEPQIRVIDKTFAKELEALNINQYPREYYLTGSTTNIIGAKQVGENTPYQKLMTAMKNIDKSALKANPDLKDTELLMNKDYDLYGFKHTSNIRKYNAGWKTQEIMKANGHKHPSTTEIYLKRLGIFTDINDIAVPAM